MILLAVLTLQARQWFGPAVAVAAVAVALIAVSYLRAQAAWRVRLACAALKLLGLAALLACFLEPVWTSEQPRPGANKVAIVADNSESLKLRGKGENEARAETLRRALTGEQSTWRQQLGQTFDVHNYLADSRLQPTSDFHELNFTGHASRVGQALKSLATNFRGQPLAGVILMTDGAPTDLRADNLSLEGLPPIYPVLFGAAAPERDLAITSTNVSQTSFEDAPVTVNAEVLARGFAEQEVNATLELAGAGKDAPKQTQALTAPAEESKMVFRFQFRPEKFGTLFYRLRVEGKTTPTAQEATSANNETIVTVERRRGPYRILYLAGRPNWEYRYLHRSIEADEQTQLVALIRIARREPKFEFKGRAGESSNPLFRGFGQQSPDEVERYDQPVFVRMNTRDESELRAGFPKTAEELFGYHGIIVDDVEAEFFTPDQMTLLQRYVAERGGGLLMLGGMECFAEGKYERTAVGDLLPVYLNRRGTDLPSSNSALTLSLTREGWLQPWVRLRSSEADDRRRLDELPPIDLLNPTSAIKPGATILATVTDGKTVYPALVTQRFGRGRSAALLIGDFYHTGLGDEARMRDLEKSWRQTLRWLVADVPDPVEVRAEPAEDGQSIRIDLRARDAKFQPLENAQIKLQVEPSAGAGNPQPVTLQAEPSASEPGVYQAAYSPRQNGGYRVTAEVANEQGALAAKVESGWSTDFDAAEFRTLAPDRALMEELARRTGGRVVAADELAALARELPRKQLPLMETITWPLWHTPWFFLFALACLIAEWGIRRRNGLA